MDSVSQSMEEDLRDTAREVARETQVSATQAADALYYLSSSGMDAAESMEAMPTVAEFSEAAGDALSMADAADIATNAASAFGYEASELSEVTDTLAGVTKNHNQTVSDMSSAMSQVAPVASSLGLSIEETATAIGMLGDQGISAEKSGTALRNVLSQLSDSSSTASQDLESMGVAVRDGEGDLLSFSQILTNMEEAGVEASEATKLFGQEAGPAMAALLSEGGAALDKNTGKIKEMEGASGDLAEEQRGGLNAQLGILRDNVADLGIEFGSVLLPAVTTATGVVSKATDRFRGLDDSQKRIVVSLLGIAAAIGPVIAGLGTIGVVAPAVSGGIATLSGAATGAAGAFGTMWTALLGPVGVVIAAIAGLIAIGAGLRYAWNNNIHGIRDTTEAAFQRVKNWFTSAPAWMLALLGPVGQLYLAYRENLFGVRDIVDNVFDFIGSKIGWLIDRIQSLPGINFGDDDVDVDETAVEEEGAAAGETYSDSFEASAQPDSAAMMLAGVGADTSEAIKGEMTPEIRQALEDGVDGYVSDPDEIEDAPTEINEDLYNAVVEDHGGSAENLGVSESEFQLLMRRYESGSGASSSTPSVDLLSSGDGPTGVAGSGGMTPDELKTALRDVLDGLRLETRLETDQRGLEQFIEDIADAQIADAGGGRP
ncbi:phage tail tape measure protein, TP901 family [Halorubrum tebenquichense DSM 14210]|uniref:Phage tail tape measure protein, TP901 family n=2 Tax=Halorubrum tebenquichense TaxID=119434 RepID=M0DKZ2_9EURY|nr:phage tail tape measure protein, TP901 family [Halorubrum tebenquichense DSM 14210]